MTPERLLLNLGCLLLLGGLYRIIKNSHRKIGYLEFYGLVWGPFIIGAQFMGSPYTPSFSTTLLFYSAWLLFMLPSFWLCSGHRDDSPLQWPSATSHQLRAMKKLVWGLLLLSLIANGWMVYQIAGDLNLVRFGLIALRFQGQRLQAEQSTVFFQLFARTYGIYLPIACWLYWVKAIRLRSLMLIALIAFITATINLTRAPLLLCAVTLSTSVLIFFRPSRRQLAGLGLLVLLPVLAVTAGFGYDLATLQTIMATYFWGSIPAFEALLDGRFPDNAWYDSGLYSFDFLNYTLHKLTIINSYPSLVRPYAPGPITTNVYTYLDAMTLDFGLVGVWLSALLLGTLAAYTHRQAYQFRSPFVVAFYGFVNYAIAISFMNNELIRVNAFLLAFELWLLNKLIFYKTTKL